LDGEESHRATPPYGNGIARTDAALLRRHVPRREDVREEEHLLVAQVLRHLDGTDVGEGDARVLRLTAGIAAEQVRVAEESCRRVPPELLGEPGVGIGILAERMHRLLSEEARAAGDRERIDHTVADFQFPDLRAYLDDLAHELVAD